MAVTLPPALPPQLGQVEQLRAHAAGAIELAYREFHLHVSGPRVLGRKQLEQAIANADNLSNAVRALASAYYAAGYPAAQLTYALSGSDLYILVTLGRVTTAAGPDYLTDYFEGMDASGPLTASKLEPRRTLASVHADRAGQNATPLLLMQADGAYQLDFKPDNEGPKPTSLRLSTDNSGNRFVGRHFADLDLKRSTRAGDEFHFGTRQGLSFLNRENHGGRYAEYDLAWNRVTPYGVFGLTASNVRYRTTLEVPPDTRVLGNLNSGEFDWMQVLAGDFRSRWTVQTRVGRTDKWADAENVLLPDGSRRDLTLQHELYWWAEVGTRYSWAQSFGAQRLSLEGGVSAGKGLSRNNPEFPQTDLLYFVWRPTLKVQLQTSKAINLGLDASGQLSKDSVPEQQQWILGGLNNGEAYLPGIAVGDTGLIARSWLEYAGISVGEDWKVVPRAFAEYGAAKLNHPPSTQLGGRPAVADAGLELALAWRKLLELGLAWAEPFHHRDLSAAQLDQQRANFFLHLTGRFSF